MTGRVLSEEEIQSLENKLDYAYEDEVMEQIVSQVGDLIATVRDLQWQVNHASETIRDLAGHILHWEETAKRLDRTVKDRDKTIEQWETHSDDLSKCIEWHATRRQMYERQSAILREALEQAQWYRDGVGWMRCPVCGWTQDAGHGTDCAIVEALAKVRGDA